MLVCGRFLTADTESPNGALTQGFTPYHSTGNNPTTRTDPSGHSWLEGIGAAITAMTEAVINLIGIMRWVNSNDRIPQWGKDFIHTLVVFAVQTVMTLVVMLLFTVVMEATGVGNSMIGRAIGMARLRVLGKMTEIGQKCLGNQSCRRMAGWIVRNPDCAVELADLTFSLGTGGVAAAATGGGAASLAIGSVSAAKECLDRSPFGGTDGQNPKNRCSFGADTGVLLADGSTRAISEIEVGDWVLAEDPETGARGAHQVTALWAHQDELVGLQIDGDVVKTTEDHPFWNATDSEWQRADQIDQGESVLTADGDLLPVDGIDWATRTGGIAYNLTVAELHTYFVVVGDAEVLVHNTCGGFREPDLGNLSDKIQAQMPARNWTHQDLADVVNDPKAVYTVRDRTVQPHQPASAYAKSDNEYVVVNDLTGQVIQVSDKTRPDWSPVWKDPLYQWP